MRRDIEGERILCRLCTACGAEVGFNPTTRRLWPDLKPWVGDLTNWATQVPLGLHFNFSGIYAGELQLLGQIVCPCLFFLISYFIRNCLTLVQRGAGAIHLPPSAGGMVGFLHIPTSSVCYSWFLCEPSDGCVAIGPCGFNLGIPPG